MRHVIGPEVAVEVAEMVLLTRVREPARISEYVARLIVGRHEIVDWRSGRCTEPTLPGR